MDGLNVISKVNEMQGEDVTKCISDLDDRLADLQNEIISFCKKLNYDGAYEAVFEYDRLNEIKAVLVAIRNIKVGIE